MAQRILSNGETGKVVRDAINDNFTELFNNVSTVSVKNFGATGNGSINDAPAIQSAIDFAITNNIKQVYFPVGIYRIDSPLIVSRQVGGAYTLFNLDLIGAVNSNAPVNSQVTRINATFKNTFAIGVQNARSCTIKNLYITGSFSYNKSTKELFEQDLTSWVYDCRDETNSPYSGIVIDPFGTSLPPDGGYPGLSSYYKASAAGSAAVTIEYCYIVNFVVGVLVSAYNTPNAENINIYNCKIYTTKVATAYGQPQTRANVIRDCFVFSCFTAIDTTSYGQQIGSAPQVDGFIISKVKNILSIDTSRGCFNAKGIEAEAFWRIGVATGTKGAAFYSCIFKFYYGVADSGYAKAPDTIILGGYITFYNCDFNKAGDSIWNANFSGTTNVSLYDCTFDTQTTPYHSLQNSSVAIYKNSRVKNLLVTDDTNRYASSSFSFIPYHGATLLKTADNLAQSVTHKVQPTTNGNSSHLGSFVLTVDGSNSIATFTLPDTSKVKVGDAVYDITSPGLFYNLTRLGLYSDQSSRITSPFIGTISAIDGTTVTIKDLPYYVVTGTYLLSVKWSSVYTGSMLGTCTSGSPVITNVYQENPGFSYVGQRLRLRDPSLSIPYGAYVIAEDKVARTLTLSANCTSTVPSAFIFSSIFDREIRVSAAPESSTGLFVEVGDTISTSYSSSKYRCTGSGIVGNATHSPSFNMV